jgi:uncharacterized protein DUF4389
MQDPVDLEVSPPTGPRDRLTVLLRPLLALPHALLVGGPVLGLGGGGYRTGAFGLLAVLIAFLDWAAILLTGRPLEGLQDLKRRYLGWRARVLAYCAFLRDEYPPFGEGPYPAVLHLPDAPPARDRLNVGLRPLLVLPHLLVLAVLLLVWLLVAIYTWVVLVATGQHPPALWRFGRDVMRYSLRVEAYLLLMHDQFPSFALFETPQPAPQPG